MAQLGPNRDTISQWVFGSFLDMAALMVPGKFNCLMISWVRILWV